MSKYYKIPEIRNAAKQYKYRLLELRDQNGQKTNCPGMGVTEKVDSWIDKKLVPFMQRPGTTPGAYFVNAYYDTTKRGAPDVYPIYVGKMPVDHPATPPPAAPIIIHQGLNEPGNNPLSWESALQYQNTISDLRSQVHMLQLENDRLRAELDSVDTDEPDTLQERAGNFLEGLMPVVDSFMSEREKTRQFEFMKLTQQNPHLLNTPWAQSFLPPPPNGNGHMHQRPHQVQPKQQQPDFQGFDPEMIKAAEEFFDTLEDDEFDQVEKIKKNTRNLPEFFEAFERNLPELYSEMYDFIYGEEETEEGGADE